MCASSASNSRSRFTTDDDPAANVARGTLHVEAGAVAAAAAAAFFFAIGSEAALEKRDLDEDMM